ncbi:hypothetical protein GIB67_042702 [Kingdonia uniflora]|uniref:Uncharacterized protein n=1 Tax=Kingdonia uniflora TaxID=39325 RepID=A0A7J7NDN5_9MAGN|nr:hypothetical protein GIB67_042702 [Kingdonia uniflora]
MGLLEEAMESLETVNYEARKYKTAPLQHRDLLEKLFEGLSATGDFAWSSVSLAEVNYSWDGEVIPSYDAPISPIREPTLGSTSHSRTPVPQSNWRRSAVAAQPLEPTELVQSLISAFTAQGASSTSYASNDDPSTEITNVLKDMREDKEPMELLYRTVKKSPQSKVTKESMLDIATRKGVELEGVLKDLESTTLRKLAQKFLKKRIVKRGLAFGTMGSGQEDELRAVEDKVRLATRKGTEEMSASVSLELRKMAARLLKGICHRIEEGKANLENRKEVHISEPTEEVQKNLDEVVIQRDRLECQLLLVGYSKAEVKFIMKGTYVKEDEVEDDVAGVVGEFDGDSLRTELENQGEDNKKVELKATRLSEQETLQYNKEYAVEFNRLIEATEDREDQHVKVYFKFVEATQTIDDLTLKIEGKDAKIKRWRKELVEVKEETTKLKRWNDALMVKGKEADMAQYRIQSLEAIEKELWSFVANLKG